MAWITPEGYVILYKNVPLLPNHKDTVYFDSEQYQQVWFNTYKYKEYTDISYQRVNRNTIRLEGWADDFYDINYIAFKNRNFGTKWFYAFIMDAEYINNNTVELHYKIDVIQTWMFEMQLLPSFVEREHSRTDVIGENRVAEPIDISSYYMQSQQRFGIGEPWAILAVAPQSSITANQIVSGMYNPMYYYAEPMTAAGANALNAALWLMSFADQKDHVLNAFMFPKNLFDVDVNPVINTQIVSNASPKALNLVMSRPQSFRYIGSSGSYTPNNKKTLTYPYVLARINTCSTTEDFDYDNFDQSGTQAPQRAAVFTLYGIISSEPKIVVVPINYDGVTRNVNKTVIDSTFTQLPIYAGTFFNYLGQGGIVSSLLSMSNAFAKKEEQLMRLTDTKTSSGGINKDTTKVTTKEGKNGPKVSTTTVRTTTKISGNVQNTTQKSLPEDYDYKETIIPQILSQSSPISEWSYSKGDSADTLSLISYNGARLRDVYGENWAVSGEEAEVIDNFFSYYGYAVSKIKVPNIHVRERWTFVKTNGCKVRGNINSADLDEITAIFDSGITFWDWNVPFGSYINPATGKMWENPPMY